jgi:hypothetical protein
MKAFRILITVISLGAISLISSCGGGGGAGESTQDKQLGLLSKTWKVDTSAGVTLGGVDSPSHWANFQLVLSGTKGSTSFNYSCTGRPKLSVWPAGGGSGGLGTWSFGSDPTTQIIRDPASTTDDLAMTYTLTGTKLVIKFNFSGTGYTRTDNVGGNWIFNLVSE